jgi:outer membrane protein assembly factor BamB
MVDKTHRITRGIKRQISKMLIWARFPFCILILVFFQAFYGPAGAYGHDWPTWRYDAARSAACPEELPGELHLQWVRQLAPPQPAWPASQTRLQFDASYEPIVAGKTLFVGSTACDCVTAYDAETGTQKWRFYTDGPVRFAPVAYKDKLYFACDDGYLYCLNVNTGALISKLLGGPAGDRVIGNHRLISMWPARGGPALYEGTIYFAAGIWPFMGTFIHAIDADSGRVLWTNSGSGPTYLLQPHRSPAFAGVAPQGYLVATRDKLLVSGGRSVPAAYDRKTGRFLYYRLSEAGKTGSCEVMARGRYFFNAGAVHALSDGSEVATAPVAVAAADCFISNQNDIISAFRLEPGRKATKPKALWRAKLPFEIEKIHLRAGSRLYCTGRNDSDQSGSADANNANPTDTILAVDMPEGDNGQAEVSWQAKVDGEVWSMLAADGKLFVVTLEGGLYCFAGKEAEAKHYRRQTEPLPAGRRWLKNRVRQILKTTGGKEGYCLLLGLGKGRLLDELVRQSKLHVVALDPNAEKVAAAHRKLDEAGLYGTRASVHVGDITTMQLPPYMANLIVSANLRAAGEQKGDLFFKRVFHSLRPYGGTACFLVRRNKRAAIIERLSALKLPRCTVSHPGGFVNLTRAGALPGSADWTHQYADSANTVMSPDKRVKAPLGLLWFGGPPNDKILPRHGHGPSPQVAGGRLFIEGPNLLRAVDVYTGRLLWERQFNDLGEYYDYTEHQPGANEIGSNYVCVPDAVYVLYGDTIQVLDPATGATIKQFSMPGNEDPRWSSIHLWQDLLVATASPLYVPLKDTKPDPDDLSRAAIDARYASASKVLVAMDRHRGRVLWKRDAKESFRHNAIAVAAGKVFCIDGMSDAKLDTLKRRGIDPKQVRTLYALDAGTGEVLWKTTDQVFGTWLAYAAKSDVLLEASSRCRDRALDEADRGMTAYRGSDGKVFWRNDDSYKGPPILHDDWIITQDGGGIGSAPVEARAYDLLTGRIATRKNAMTGQMIPWTWVRFYGCNTAIASENLLTFRSASGSFVDLTAGQGTASIGGFKSGCTSNLIIADGVLNAPDYTRTCVCSYQNQASLALVPDPEVAYWTFDYYPVPSKPTPVKRVGINFGAPGDRTAADGTLWLEYPSVGGPSPDIPVRAEYENPSWFRYDSSLVKGPYNWITASGVTGLKEVRIRMFVQPGRNPKTIPAFDKHLGKSPTWPEGRIKGAFGKPRLYTVRLFFAETADPGAEACQAGRRVFDVSLQGNRVLQDFDIAKEAGGINRTVIKEFRGIRVKDDLKISLTPAGDPVSWASRPRFEAGTASTQRGQDALATPEPLLCGVEITAEGW